MEELYAVDLGNGFCKGAVLEGVSGAPQILITDGGETALRSVVFFEQDGTILYGTEAENALLLEPAKGVRVWKRHLGSDKVLIEIEGKQWRAKDICELLLKKMLEIHEHRTGRVATSISLTIPHNYTDDRTREVMQAAKNLNLKLAGDRVHHEPSAAAMGCEVFKRHMQEAHVLVLDVGCGTTDVSLVRVAGGIVDVISTNGVELGGMDWTDRLLEHPLKEFEAKHNVKITPESHPHEFTELYRRVEQAKVSLASKPQVKIPVLVEGKALNVAVSQEAYLKLTEDLIEKALECADKTLKDAGMQASEIKEFLAVGGGALTHGFSKAIEKRFGKLPTEHCDAHHCVVKGGLILGRIALEREGEVFKSESGRALPPIRAVMNEVTSHPVGIAVANKNGELENALLLKRFQPIPCEKMEIFRLCEPGQENADILLLQGEGGIPAGNCVKLGEGRLEGLPKIFDKPHRIEIHFKIDRAGLVTAQARCPVSGKCVDVTASTKTQKNGNGGTP